MAQQKCRRHGCDNERREKGELQYPDNPDAVASNGERFKVSSFGAKFCSTHCELKHEHIKADARDAQREEAREQEAREERRDLPEYDGPPY